MMPTFIRTYTGAEFSVEPKAENVDIVDIAHALAMQPRWGGHTKIPYTVAAHSIYVSKLVPRELAMSALLHDGSEAYACDIPAPFKAILPGYKELESKIMGAIAEKFKIQWPCPPEVKAADAYALYQERLHLFDSPVGKDCAIAEKPPIWRLHQEWDFNFWSSRTPKELKAAFIQCFKMYATQD